jgi:eukaryotic-like serine/threonine-protein kinase
MKIGEVIGGYVLTTDASTAGGGQSQWAFARRGDTEFFIKQFLAPTYPTPESPGGVATKAQKLKRCELFERQHRAVANKLKPISGEGGNLVVTKSFFRHGARYYKVTEKIDVSGLEPADIARMDIERRLLVMLTAAHSIETLHVAGLVHGDIKPPNVLIKQIHANFAAKIIDFDNCFVAYNPPPPEELVGDPAYYSPELMQYVLDGTGPEKLSAKTDVFALSMVFWQYTTGSFPVLPAGYHYPADAARAGRLLTLTGAAASDPVTLLIASMLDVDPDRRPNMKEVHNALKRIRKYGTDEPPVVGAGRRVAGVLRGTLRGRRAVGAAGTAAAGTDGAGPGIPRLRGSLAPDGKAPDGSSSDTVEGKLRGSLLKKKL